MIQGNEQKLIPLFVWARMSAKLQLVVDLDKNRPKMNTDQKSKKIGPPYGHVSILRSSSFTYGWSA